MSIANFLAGCFFGFVTSVVIVCLAVDWGDR